MLHTFIIPEYSVETLVGNIHIPGLGDEDNHDQLQGRCTYPAEILKVFHSPLSIPRGPRTNIS